MDDGRLARIREDAGKDMDRLPASDSTHPVKSRHVLPAVLKFRNACGRLAVNPSLTRKTKQNETMTHTHTPGEREIFRADRSECNESAGREMAGCLANGEKVLAYFPTVSAMANAHLISAAHDMLEALQMLMPQEPQEADSYDRAMWENARAAIAKATGKEDA
jgi:hypothetical protein